MHYSRAHIGRKLTNVQIKNIKRVWVDRSELMAGRLYKSIRTIPVVETTDSSFSADSDHSSTYDSEDKRPLKILDHHDEDPTIDQNVS